MSIFKSNSRFSALAEELNENKKNTKKEIRPKSETNNGSMLPKTETNK